MFTCEVEKSNSLPFLDLNVTRKNSSFTTSIYRKPTFSGLGISFFSFCPFNFKVNSIKTLLHRAYHLCSTFKDFHNEIEFLKQFFIKNGFPSNLFYSLVRKLLDNTAAIENDTVQNRKNIYFSLQYFGYQSEKMSSELSSLFNSLLPTVKTNIILANKYTIGSLFKFKDSLPNMSRSCVVYKYICPQCGAAYVGSTTRTLHTRMSEHMGVSPRTGMHLSQPPHSSIRVHSEQSCQCAPSKLAFSIIDCDSHQLSLRIKESIHIKLLKPSLNETTSCYPLNVLN